MRTLIILFYLLLVSQLNGQHRYYTSAHKPLDSNRIENILFINPYKAIDTGCINEISYNYHRYIRGLFIEIDSIGNEENWSFNNLIDRLENITLDYIGINIKIGKDEPHFDVSSLLNNTKLKALFDTAHKYSFLNITSSQKLYSKELLSIYEIENVDIYCEKLIFNNDSIFVNQSVKSVSLNAPVFFSSEFSINAHIEELNRWSDIPLKSIKFADNSQSVRFEKLISIYISPSAYKKHFRNNFRADSLKYISLFHVYGLRWVLTCDFEDKTALSDIGISFRQLRKIRLKKLPDSIRIDVRFVKKSAINVNKGHINELWFIDVKSASISCNSCDQVTIKSMYTSEGFTFKVSQKTYVENLYYGGSSKGNFSKLRISDRVHISNMNIGYSEISDPEKSAKRLKRLNVDTLTIKIRVAAPGELEDQLIDCPAMGKDMASTEEECEKLSRLKELLPGKVIEVVPY